MLLLLIITVFFCTWFQMVFIHRAQDLHLPFPSKAVTRVTGLSRFDSSVSAKGNTTVFVTIESAYDRYGDWGTAKGSVLMILPDHEPVEFGQRIDVEGTFFPIEETLLFAATTAQVIDFEHPVKRLYHRLRMKILRFIVDRITSLPGDSASLASALLVGRVGSYSMLREYTMRSGCAHVLALSGMHLHAIIAVVSLILKRVMHKRRRACITIPLAIVYVAVVGNKPSLIRALIMVVTTSFSKRWSQREMLSVGMVIHVWTFPLTIDTPGSLLSYGALAALFYVSPVVARYLAIIMPKRIALLCATSLSAALCTAPLSLSLFGAWYGIGMALSPLLAPLALGVLACAFVWVILPFSWCAISASVMTQWFTSLVTWGSAWSSEHGWLQTTGAWMVTMVLLLTVVGFLKYASRIEHRRRCQRHDMGFSLRFPPSDHRTA